MDLVSYLTNIYGYDTPIFIKDVRIGRKSKSAIREEFYRASKKGEIIKEGSGVYYIKSQKEFGAVITFEEVLAKKFIYSKDAAPMLEDLFIEGYYSGLTFLNMIGISEQVPAVLEITTNRTSSKKRIYKAMKSKAIIRKSRTVVNFKNYKILQFLDMFHFLDMKEVIKNKELLRQYIINNQLMKYDLGKYIGLYSSKTIKMITEGGLIDAFIG